MPTNDLNVLGAPIVEVYEAVTDRVVENLARHFKLVEPGEAPGGAFEFQAQKLAELGQVRRETVDIIASMLDGADAALTEALEAAILDALYPLEPELKRAAALGLLTPMPDVPAEPSPRMMRAFRTYYEQSADKLNLVNTVMLESTQEAYQATVSDITSRMRLAQSALNVAAGEVITGAESFNQAQRLAVQKLVENGITGFVDHGGHRWRPETYVAMDMRSTMHNAARAAFWERCEAYGNDLYLVSQHPGARPLCYPWQCKVISRADEARDVRDGDGNKVHVYAQSETSYGEPAGLFGINCGHHPMLFIPGVTKIPALDQDAGENAETYAISQKQRKLERDFRKARLAMNVAKAQGDKEGVKAAGAKLRQADQRLDAFCEQTGRKRRREREYAPVNATWPEKAGTEKALTDGGKDDKIVTRWGEANFLNEQAAQKHQKHLSEYGLTWSEYVQGARDLLNQPITGNVDGFVNNNGGIYRYDTDNNDFAIGMIIDGKHVIITRFKPKEGLSYWKGVKESEHVAT